MSISNNAQWLRQAKDADYAARDNVEEVETIRAGEDDQSDGKTRGGDPRHDTCHERLVTFSNKIATHKK